MSNPMLGRLSTQDSFNSLENETSMTINGTILKTTLLALLSCSTFAYSWYLLLAGFADKAMLLYQIGLWGGLAIIFAIAFLPKNKSLIITTPLYALCEGLALGYFSAIANKYYPGIVPQAALGTFITLFTMLALYASKIIKCTDKFRAVIFTSTISIAGIYLLQLILSFFHISIPGIFSNGLVGIGFSLIVIAIAAFNLIIDFDNISKYSGQVDKNFEWYFGVSLLVTIIWLYIEILNLLMKLQSRR